MRKKMAKAKTSTKKVAAKTAVQTKAQASAKVGLLSAADRKEARELTTRLINIPFIWGIIVPDWMYGRRTTAAERRQVTTLKKNMKSQATAFVKTLQKLETVAAKIDKK